MYFNKEAREKLNSWYYNKLNSNLNGKGKH